MSGQATLPSLDGENFTTKMVWIQLSRFDQDLIWILLKMTGSRPSSLD
jgi:hypothetical protein